MSNILVTTLGGTWQIVPELFGFTNPDLLDLYCHHPERESIRKKKEQTNIKAIDELWMLTTDGKSGKESIEKALEWHSLLAADRRPTLRFWQVSETDNLSSEEECKKMTEAILRLVLHASEQTSGLHTDQAQSQLLLSLAGGRKTMSSDMQFAANIFGCHALLHVIDNNGYNKLKDYTPKQFTQPLPETLYDVVTPIFIGQYNRNPLLDLDKDDDYGSREMRIISANYAIDIPKPSGIANISTRSPILLEEIERRQREAAFLIGNYFSNLIQSENTANFLAIYSLPPEIVQYLKNTRIGVNPENEATELEFLQRLPKAELHCHLGGILDAKDLLRVAQANDEQIERYQSKLSKQLNQWRKQLDQLQGSSRESPIDIDSIYKAVPDVPVPICTTAFLSLFNDHPELLDNFIFGQYLDEKQFCKIEFDKYEKLGDLQGSRLLQNAASITETCKILREKRQRENILCMEIRCSPTKYTKGGLSDIEVVNIIATGLDEQDGIILTVSRHQGRDGIQAVLNLAKKIQQSNTPIAKYIKALDLAGNEESCSAADMRKDFYPLLKECVHITIHAGETAPADSIWQAVYELNAERIGHGLTLIDNPALIQKFHDRKIAIEMCPSSNIQIVGFHDNFLPNTQHLSIYPLAKYIEHGLRVTVNTDNPGISRTTLSRELHRAARLTPNGLSLWDILVLLRNSFKALFVTQNTRQKLLQKAERQIINILQNQLALLR
jgi:adenosine deaminase